MSGAKGTWTELTNLTLRRRGHRRGAARAVVIRTLDTAGRCLSAQEIAEQARALGHPIGIASAYRVVERLHALGLVHRVDLGDGVARYQPAIPDAGHHHHLVCVDCGDVTPFEDHRIAQALEGSPRLRGFAVLAHEVVVRGRCPDCGTAGGSGLT